MPSAGLWRRGKLPPAATGAMSGCMSRPGSFPTGSWEKANKERPSELAQRGVPLYLLGSKAGAARNTRPLLLIQLYWPAAPSGVQIGVVGHVAKDVHFTAVRAVALLQFDERAVVKHGISSPFACQYTTQGAKKKEPHCTILPNFNRLFCAKS